LAIVGYRGFDDYPLFKLYVDAWIKKHGKPNDLISGGCKGTDKMAERYAQENGIEMCILEPDWLFSKDYRACFMERDRYIAMCCNYMLAFPSNMGKGTQITMDFARRFNRPLTVVKLTYK